MSSFGSSSGHGTSPNNSTAMNNSANGLNAGNGTATGVSTMDGSATMSRKFSPLARTLRKNTLRAKEMMLTKFNKHHDRTADEMFDDYAVQIQRQHVVAARFSKELKTYAVCVKALANASKMLNIVMRDEAFEASWHGAPQFIATTHASESIWNDYCDMLNSQILPTTQLYLDQFAAIQARIAKRNRKLVDYDGARHELTAAETAKKRDEQKVLKAEEFLTQAKFTFENLNDELRRQMPRVRDSRVMFYAKTMHDLADIEQKFHAKISHCQQQNVPALAKLVEEAEAGHHKSEWRSEATRTQQHSATFQNNFHKRQQKSAVAAVGVGAVPNYDRIVVMESHDMQMSAPPETNGGASSSSSAVLAEKQAVYSHTDDELDNNNNNGSTEYDADDHYDSSADSDVSVDENKISRRRQSSSSQEKAAGSRSRSSGGGFSGAASRMRNAIVAKANGILNNNATTSNGSKRDSGVEDEHDSRPANGGGDVGGLFPEGAVDAEDVDAGVVEFKGIRRLDDDGVPTRDAETKMVSRTTNSGARPPLPPAPSLHLRQQQQQQQQFHQRQQSTSSASSAAASNTMNVAVPLVVNSTESMKSPEEAASSSNNNVSRIMLRQTSSSTAESPQVPASRTVAADRATTNESDLVLAGSSSTQLLKTELSSPLKALLQSRKVLYRARATHAYKGEDADELSFSASEIIYVVEYENPDDQDVGWQMGIRAATGDIGVFPENFTRVLMNE